MKIYNEEEKRIILAFIIILISFLSSLYFTLTFGMIIKGDNKSILYLFRLEFFFLATLTMQLNDSKYLTMYMFSQN